MKILDWLSLIPSPSILKRLNASFVDVSICVAQRCFRGSSIEGMSASGKINEAVVWTRRGGCVAVAKWTDGRTDGWADIQLGKQVKDEGRR